MNPLGTHEIVREMAALSLRTCGVHAKLVVE
jgi:hypothetical protein